MGFRYGLVYRPAMLGAVPRGCKFTVLPRPEKGQAHHEVCRHGIMDCEAALSDEELASFELAELIDESEIAGLAGAVCESMGEYASEYLAVMEDSAQEFERGVASAVERLSPKRIRSVYSMDALTQAVHKKLKSCVEAGVA